MSKENLGYKINPANNTVILQRKFVQLMNVSEAGTYDTYLQLKRDFPEMRFIHRAPKKPSSKSLVTYANMGKYIGCIDNSDKYLAQFEMVKSLARSRKGSASYTKKWFFATFPDFYAIPTFDANNKPIIRIDEVAGRRIIEEITELVAA